MFLTHPVAIVVATNNRVIASRSGIHAGVSTIGWAAAERCAGGAPIGLSHWAAELRTAAALVTAALVTADLVITVVTAHRDRADG
jgi:hypothetical protein